MQYLKGLCITESCNTEPLGSIPQNKCSIVQYIHSIAPNGAQTQGTRPHGTRPYGTIPYDVMAVVQHPTVKFPMIEFPMVQ